jgi:predicted ribosomally synthesized peptide with nif11-like leader
MSVQTALRFIRDIRTDESLQNQIKALGATGDLERVVQIADAAGYVLSAADLQTAFKHDWALRWMYYTGRSQSARQSKPIDSEANR